MFLLHLGQTLFLSNPMDAADAGTTLTGTMMKLRVIAAAVAVAISPALAAAQTPQQLADLDLEDLMRISVQRVFGASERLQPVTEAPSAVTIVTADEIRRYGYRTLGEILAGVRGFFVSNDRNYSYLGARGFGRPGDYNTRVLLLVNGHRTNDNVFDQAYIGAELGIDVAMFERVEIIRGPASSLYGTSAFFAVVNVVTRSGASMKGASIEADAGTLGTQLARASFGRELAGGADVALSGTYERSSGVGNLYFPAFDTPGTNGGVAQNLDGEDVGELYGRFKLRDFSLTAVYGRRHKLVPTASFFTLFNSQDPREQTTDEHATIDAQYDHTVGRTRLVADTFFDRARYDAIYPYAAEHEGMPVLINDDGFIGARWGAGLRATRPLPWQQTLTAGGELIANLTQDQWTSYNDPLVAGFDIRQSSRQGAIYLQDEVRVKPWLLLNGGVRYDRYQRFARTTPRGGVIVMPSPNQSFKYLYGRAFRAPNTYELYYYDDATPYLRPESIGTHEIVWEQYAGSWLRTSVSAYRYTASQLITLNVLDAGSRTGFGFFNDGTLRAKGLEGEAEVRTRRGLQLLGSYALQRAEDHTREALTNSPREMAKLRLTMPGPFARSTGAFEVQYLASRRTVAGTTVGAATLAHVTFTKRINHAFELVGTVRNLFDAQYADPASDEHSTDAIQQNGRTARIGMRWAITN
jgi:outer membrane receptor protein involved in Fe transport